MHYSCQHNSWNLRTRLRTVTDNYGRIIDGAITWSLKATSYGKSDRCGIETKYNFWGDGTEQKH